MRNLFPSPRSWFFSTAMRRSVFIVLLALVLIAIGIVAYKLLTAKPESAQKPGWPRRYAGIEIGTRAVRYAVVTIRRNDDAFEYELEGRPDSIEFDVVFDRDGRIVVTSDLKLIIRKVVDEQIIPAGVPPENIHILAGNSYQTSPNLPEFLKELRATYPAYTVNALDASAESLVELKTLKNPPAELSQILFVGVGSQTTKIAAYGGRKHIFAKSFENGVRKLTRDVIEELKAAPADRTDGRRASPVTRAEELRRLKETARRLLGPGGEGGGMGKVLTENPFRSMKVTIVTGGLPCAILQSIGKLKQSEFTGDGGTATNSLDRYSLIQQEDLDRFRAFAEEKYRSGQEGEKLCGDFSTAELVVGSELFQLLYEKSSFENKTMYYFDRLTWIPGYLVQQAENAD